ncbi:hypothetical protein CDIK_0061 [Cucumispora dikerogammari]|nr:hypothetical protein CDIK_0061 [Cucumispora dikerogammari]
MIVSKTAEFLILRKRELQTFNFKTVVDEILFRFQECAIHLKEIENLQKLKYLPSFSGRKEKTLSLNKKRMNLQLLIKELKNLIDNVEYKKRILNCQKVKFGIKEAECCRFFDGCFKIIFPKDLENSIVIYLSKKYQKLLLDLKFLEQTYLVKRKEIVFFDEIIDSIENKKDVDVKVYETSEENKQIRQTFFNINVMLHELKTHLISQESEIDRVDVHISTINNNLEMTNKEVIKYKKRHKDGKDRIIFLMIFICFSMFICLIFKYTRGYRSRDRFLISGHIKPATFNYNIRKSIDNNKDLSHIQ